MKKLSISTFTVCIICVTLFLLAVSADTSLSAFLSLDAFVITFVGSFLAILLTYSFEDIISAQDCLSNMFYNPSFDKAQIVFDFVQISRQIRKKGLLAIDDNISDISNPLVKKGLTLISLNQSSLKIRRMLKTEIDENYNQYTQKINLFKSWASYAPSFGMLGSIIGMVQMFANMTSLTSVVSGFGKAFLTTLYGILLANLVFLPIANKFIQMRDEEEIVNKMVLDGILGIKSDVNNHILRESLFAYLTKEETQEYYKKVPAIYSKEKIYA